jgi:hypothetical protein
MKAFVAFARAFKPRGSGSAENETGGESTSPPDAVANYQSLNHSNSLTGLRSSRMYIGRPLPFGKVMAGSMPIA